MTSKFQSISWKIWFSTVRVIVVIGVLFMILNTTVLSSFKGDFIFDQLETAAELKAEKYKADLTIEQSDIFHFALRKVNDQYLIEADRMIANRYDNQSNVLSTIADTFKSSGEIKERLSIDGQYHYYYVTEISPDKYLVFIKSLEVDHGEFLRIIFVMLLLMGISLFMARRTAKKISRPLEDLENFSREISKRNWSVSKPQLDNDELGRLAETMAQTRDALKHSESIEREFIQSTSHDLKTPVMIIRGYAQAIKDGVDVHDSSNALDVILSESDRLQAKINKLLQINTIDYTLQKERLDELIRLDRLLQKIVTDFSKATPHLIWDTDLEPTEIYGNTESIRVAMENILDNQGRFAESKVQVTLKSHKLTISNDGPAFTQENPDIIFDRYKRDESGQYGLGLSIVHKILQAHHLSIHAYNTETGVAFQIQL